MNEGVFLLNVESTVDDGGQSWSFEFKRETKVCWFLRIFAHFKFSQHACLYLLESRVHLRVFGLHKTFLVQI